MEILRRHPHAEPFWHGLLHGALNGDDRTAGNTVTTVQQAVSLFFQADIRRRCVPSPGHPATDLADVIRRRGTIYLLGREDPYASASPLMTAVAEHVLDTGLLLANSSPWGGRLCPPLLSVLDELPSTAPLPTLRTRMANERALGLSFIWAAQTRPQLTSIFGEHEARALLGLTNTLVMFGGSKDVAFNQEISDLLGPVRIGRVTHPPAGQRRRPHRHRRRHPDHAARGSPPAARAPSPGRSPRTASRSSPSCTAASKARPANACWPTSGRCASA